MKEMFKKICPKCGEEMYVMLYYKKNREELGEDVDNLECGDCAEKSNKYAKLTNNSK